MSTTIIPPSFVDSYQFLSISPSASELEVSKAWKRLALSLHPDKNPNEDTTEHFQKIQDAYDAIKTPKARERHDAFRDHHLTALEAAKLDAEAAALAARETKREKERWDRDQKQRKQQEKLRKEKKKKRERAKRRMAEDEAWLVSNILEIFHYRRLSPIQRALYRAKKHWDYQMPILYEFKNRIHASYQARANIHIEMRNNYIRLIIQQQQHSIHHARGQTAPKQLSDEEKLKQNQKLRASFIALRKETFEYEKAQRHWRQLISTEVLKIIGPRDLFLVENNTPDYFEPARCFWESFAEITHPLGGDIVEITTSKLWNQVSFGFINKEVGVGVVSNSSSALQNLWERRMEEGPWHCALGERVCTPVSTEGGGDICGRCCLKTSYGEHETVASRCEKCEILVCETCRVDLEMLNVFVEWVNEVGAYSGERPESFYGPAGLGWVFNGENFESEYNL